MSTHTSNFINTLDITPSTLPNINKAKANHKRQHDALPTNATGIVDSGATDIYFSTDAPVVNIYRAALKVIVGNAIGKIQQSTGTVKVALPHLPL